MGLTNFSDETLFISEPIQGYYYDENQSLNVVEDVEYYIIYTDANNYIGAVTVNYIDGEIVSTAFNTYITDELLENNILINEAFGLIVDNGKISFLTNNRNARNALNNNIIKPITKLDNIVLRSSYAQPRATSLLQVPYVAQGNYNVCWAAAGLALGRYYYPSKMSGYSPYTIASMMGIGDNGAGIDKTQYLLSNYFSISTSYTAGQMPEGTVINHINNNRPVVVGFSNSNHGHMVVVCGYVTDTSGVTKYYVRDSNTSSWTYVYPNSNNYVYMSYYSEAGVMWWNEAIVKS